MWGFVVDISQLFIADCTALCRYSGNLSKSACCQMGAVLEIQNVVQPSVNYSCFCCCGSISQLWIEVVTSKKSLINSVKKMKSFYYSQCPYFFFCFCWGFFTLFLCQVNFPNTALPVWAQPISIKWTQSVIHVEHCAVGILVQCTGACLWWLKPLYIASP